MAKIKQRTYYQESLMRETGLEAFLVEFGLGPDERFGVAIVGVDEGIDVLSELFDRGEDAPCRDCLAGSRTRFPPG